jgi:hypothetical protein
MSLRLLILSVCLTLFSTIARAESPWLWKDNKPRAHIIPPRIDNAMSALIDATVNGYFADAYGWSLPSTTDADDPGTYLLVGNETNNRAIHRLVDAGLQLQRDGLGDEGFRIFTQKSDDQRFIIVTGNTPIALKHGCQELVFFRCPATTQGASVDWPMDVSMKPQFDYRGIYVLPCWAAHDSAESWKRVLRFCSEISLNRVWFWLAGFPLLEQYGGEYTNTALADAYNVNGMVWQCRSQGMKFYIGGGWYTWHHEKIANASIERGLQYYRDMLALLPETEGIYLEPAGEGRDTDERTWRERTEAFQRLVEMIWRDRPDFEFAIAIGEFNSEPYFKMLHEIDDRRIYWWWCWGDPIRDKALDRHPLVLRWHTNVRMSAFHGSCSPPEPREAALTGFATSYDPGQGYGNPWNGWGKLGVDHPRNFHPYDMPYFSMQYWFRERCWNLKITNERFARRMSRRLFDADSAPEAIQHYLRLAELCPDPVKASSTDIAAIDAFVNAQLTKGTPRTKDTLRRMRKALDGIRQHRLQAKSKPAE